METPNHGITEMEWEEFLEGESPEGTRKIIEAHLTKCAICNSFYEEMKTVSNQLWIAATDVAASKVHYQINYLETVLTKMCGAGTAVNAIKNAAETSPAKSIDKINTETWPLFIEKLIPIAEVMCGATGAMFIKKYGDCV